MAEVEGEEVRGKKKGRRAVHSSSGSRMEKQNLEL